MTIRPLRIALLRHTLLPASETFIYEQLRHLPNVHVTCLGRRRENSDRFTLPECVLVNASGGWQGWLDEAAYVLTAQSRRFDLVLKRGRFDLVHAHFGAEGVYALAFARRHGLPLVTTFWGFDATRTDAALLTSGKPAWMRYYLGKKRLAREGTLFIATSEFIRSRLLELEFPADRIILHYAGIDLARFSPDAATDDGRTVVTVCRLVEKKGTRHLIRSFEQVRRIHPEARLQIVGDGPLRSSLERLVVDLGLQRGVTFSGALPNERVADLMKRCAIFCLPSVRASDGDSEGLGQVLLEAAATAKPLIGTRHGGIPEVVRDGQTGYLVPERDSSALAQRICSLLSDPGLRQRFGKSARAMAEREFDVRRQSATLADIYRHTVERNRTVVHC